MFQPEPQQPEPADLNAMVDTAFKQFGHDFTNESVPTKLMLILMFNMANDLRALTTMIGASLRRMQEGDSWKDDSEDYLDDEDGEEDDVFEP